MLDLYNLVPWKFVCKIRFHEFLKLHETKGRKQTSMALNI